MKRTMTPRRLEANRRNAARSTGPRTDRGKAAVALNHLTHGLVARGCCSGCEERNGLKPGHTQKKCWGC